MPRLPSGNRDSDFYYNCRVHLVVLGFVWMLFAAFGRFVKWAARNSERAKDRPGFPVVLLHAESAEQERTTNSG